MVLASPTEQITFFNQAYPFPAAVSGTAIATPAIKTELKPLLIGWAGLLP